MKKIFLLSILLFGISIFISDSKAFNYNGYMSRYIRTLIKSNKNFNPDNYKTLDEQKKLPNFNELKATWKINGISDYKDFHKLLVKINNEIGDSEDNPEKQLVDDTKDKKENGKKEKKPETLDELEAIIGELDNRLIKLKGSANKIWTKELLGLLTDSEKKLFEDIIIPVSGDKTAEKYISNFTDAYELDITTKEFLYNKAKEDRKINKHIRDVSPEEWRNLRRNYLKNNFKEQIKGMLKLRTDFKNKNWTDNFINNYNLSIPIDLLIDKMLSNKVDSGLFIKLLINSLNLHHDSIYSWLNFSKDKKKTCFDIILNEINKDKELKKQNKISLFESLFKAIEHEAFKIKKAAQNKEERLEQESAVRNLKNLYKWALMLDINPQIGFNIKNQNVGDVRNCLLREKDILLQHDKYFGKMEVVVFEQEKYVPNKPTGTPGVIPPAPPIGGLPSAPKL